MMTAFMEKYITVLEREDNQIEALKSLVRDTFDIRCQCGRSCFDCEFEKDTGCEFMSRAIELGVDWTTPRTDERTGMGDIRQAALDDVIDRLRVVASTPWVEEYISIRRELQRRCRDIYRSKVEKEVYFENDDYVLYIEFPYDELSVETDTARIVHHGYAYSSVNKKAGVETFTVSSFDTKDEVIERLDECIREWVEDK